MSNILVAVPSLTIGGMSRGEVVGSCQVWFRPRHLVVPRSVAADFDVEGVYVGTQSQFYGGGTVPAELFAGDLEAFDVGEGSPDTFLDKVKLDVPLPLKFDVCRSGVGIRVVFFNRNVMPREFRCAFYGVELGEVG
jgi:hypothetical protein